MSLSSYQNLSPGEQVCTQLSQDKLIIVLPDINGLSGRSRIDYGTSETY